MSNVCEATPIKSLFWDPNELNKLLEISVLNFPTTWLANWQWLFEQANHGLYLISWYTSRGPEQQFWHCFTDRLLEVLVLSVVQATNGYSHMKAEPRSNDKTRREGVRKRMFSLCLLWLLSLTPFPIIFSFDSLLYLVQIWSCRGTPHQKLFLYIFLLHQSNFSSS